MSYLTNSNIDYVDVRHFYVVSDACTPIWCIHHVQVHSSRSLCINPISEMLFVAYLLSIWNVKIDGIIRIVFISKIFLFRYWIPSSQHSNHDKQSVEIMHLLLSRSKKIPLFKNNLFALSLKILLNNKSKLHPLIPD